MDCQKMFARLSEYLDRELAASLCEEIRAHMNDCPPARSDPWIVLEPGSLSPVLYSRSAQLVGRRG
jgi:putative zinc finger protein